MQTKAKHPQHHSYFIPAVFPPTLNLQHGENHLDIDVRYDKGGTNMFSGNQERRGYRVSVSAVQRDGSGMTSFVIGGNGFGRRFFLAEAARFDAKKFDALDAAIAGKLAEIATLALAADYDALRRLFDDVTAAAIRACAA